MSQRRRCIVAYDICDDRRWREVYRLMRGHGDRIQYSVFRCELSAAERASLIDRVHPLIDHQEDQVIIVDLGPSDRTDEIESIGRPYLPRGRHPVII